MADEPKFLKNPPKPGAPKPAAPAAPPAPAPALAQALEAAIDEAAGHATDALIRTTLWFKRRRWDADARPPASPVVHRMGGMTITVPRSWVHDAAEQRAMVWTVANRALISLHALGFTKRVPTVEEYAASRTTTMGAGWLRIGSQQLAHASGHRAMELAEFAGADPRRPLRVLRFLQHPASIVLFKLDTDGTPPDAIGAEFAQAFASLSFR